MNDLSSKLITVDSLKAILGIVLKSPQKGMNPKRLANLVKALDNIRRNFDGYEHQQTLAALQHEHFVTFMLNLRAFVRNEAKYEYSLLNEFEQELIKNAETALHSFDALAKLFTSRGILIVGESGIVNGKRQTWRDIVATIATEFTYAMDGQKLGTSNEGPVVRFVHAVIPVITGATPTRGAVAKRLKDIVKLTKQQTGTTSIN